MGIQLQMFNASSIYEDTIRDLQSIIISRHGSVKKFCEEQSPVIDRFNLSKVFTAIDKPEKNKDMSVGLYMRVCAGLGLLDPQLLDLDNLKYDVSLRDYLVIDNNAIMRTIILINKC